MSTLSQQFPLVQLICLTTDKNAAELVQPYLSWKMVTVDDYFSLLLTKHIGELSRAVTSDLVILVGAVAQEWLQRNSAQSGD